MPAPTETEIRDFHRALNLACRLPHLEPTINDIMRWRDFLSELAPLASAPGAGGPVTPADIQALADEMRAQQKTGIPWSLRPSKILRDPEAARDLILITRARRRQATRPRPPATIQTPQTIAGATRLTELPPPDPDLNAAFLTEIAALRQRLRPSCSPNDK